MGLFRRRNEELFTVPPVAPGFLMRVVDVFFIAGRGTVITGTVEAGAVAVGAPVTVERAGRPPLSDEIAGIELVRRKVQRAGAGDNVGLLLRGPSRGEIAVGDVVRTA